MFLNHHPFYFLIQSLSPNLEFPGLLRLAVQQSSGTLLSLLPQCWDSKYALLHPEFMGVLGDNFRFLALTAFHQLNQVPRPSLNIFYMYV